MSFDYLEPKKIKEEQTFFVRWVEVLTNEKPNQGTRERK